MKNLAHSDLESFHRVCRAADLSEKCGKRFMIDEVDIAVFKVDGKIYATGNVCPHQHTALIYDGFIDDGCVVCPAHGWMFNLQTGKTPSGNGRLDVHEVKLIDDDVYVKIKKHGWNW